MLHDGVSLTVSKVDVIWPCASLVGCVGGGVGRPDTLVSESLSVAAEACRSSEQPKCPVVENSLFNSLDLVSCPSISELCVVGVLNDLLQGL